MNTESTFYPLGRAHEQFGVSGAVGIDGYGTATNPLPRELEGKKKPVTYEEQYRTRSKYGITIPAEREYPAGTALGIAEAIAKSQRKEDPAILLFAPLSTTDTTYVKRVTDEISQHNIELIGTSYADKLPYSVVVRNGNDKTLWTAKPINPDLEGLDGRVKAIAVGPLGNFEGTYHDIANLEVPRAVIGNSIIDKLTDPNKPAEPRLIKAYMRVIEGAGGLFVNDEEAARLLALKEQTPKESPQALARQLQEAFDIPFVSMSRGPEGAIVWAGDEMHDLKITPVPEAEMVNTTGCGDAFAGELIATVREGGTETDNIARGLERSAVSAGLVARTQDSLSGQMRREQEINGYASGFEHRHFHLKKLATAGTIIDLKGQAH